MSIADLIAKKKKAMDANKAANLKTVKPMPGKHKYRILPSWRKATQEEIAEGLPAPFWHDFALHWVKTEKNGKPVAVYVCTEKTFGHPCDICDAINAGIAHSKSEDQADVLKESRSRQSYLLNALHRNGSTPNAPILLEVGATTFEQILEIMGEYGDITSLDKGVDISINRAGTGFDTTYTCIPAPNSLPVDESVMQNLVDLDAVVAQENATKQRAALTAVGQVSGLLTATPATPKTQAKSSFGEDAEIDEGDFEEIDDAEMDAELEEAMSGSPKKAAVVEDDDIDLDDIDAMLAAEG